ncbi:MAG: hypothetical protein D6798_15870 [Deltaproteobacteria bacterium]|nr:MAG: hypothetical protein D6798_15870 [Deltaproteobacteria bacterium]
MRDHLILAGMVVAVFSGCSLLGTPIDQDTFYETFSKEACKQLKKCNRGAFESWYRDVNDCIDDLMNNADDAGWLDDWDNCSFDDDQAADCLDTLATSECDEVYEYDAFDDCAFDEIFYNCD